MSWSIASWLRRKHETPVDDEIKRGFRDALRETMNETEKMKEGVASSGELKRRIEDTADEGRRLMTGET